MRLREIKIKMITTLTYVKGIERVEAKSNLCTIVERTLLFNTIFIKKKYMSLTYNL